MALYEAEVCNAEAQHTRNNTAQPMAEGRTKSVLSFFLVGVFQTLHSPEGNRTFNFLVSEHSTQGG